jgi:RNA polymerase sigma factor (sigma-70 family)
VSDQSATLLRQYAHERSQQAFAELVRLYVDMVYAAARRQVRDSTLADDVTQAVFIILAQKAASIPTERPLSAWLLRTTSYCASNARRTREHRQFHERRAAEMARDMHDTADDGAGWEELAPLLDEGLNKLGAGERDALLLKYFEKKSLRQVGEALGISEDAATKRVSRAVERLRVFFQRRGTVVSAIALTTLLASESAKAAPVALAGSIATGATSGAAGAGAASVAKGAMGLMFVQRLKLAALAASVLLVGVGGVYIASTASAPRPRTVAVNIPPALVAPSMTKSRIGLTFSDGTSVEVLGLCDPDITPEQWWSADGSAALPPNVDLMSAESFKVEPGQAKRRMIFRLFAPTNATRSLTVHPSTPMPIQSINGPDRGSSSGMVLNCLVAIPAGAGTTSIDLKLGGGPGDGETVTLSNVALFPTTAKTDVRVERHTTQPAISRATQ